MKRILAILLAVVMACFCLTACGGGGETNESGVKSYTVEANFNSETVNQWKTFYLLDEDTYTLTVYALDSKDNSIVTADFYMTGAYTTNADGSITIQPGYGYTKAMNGSTPIEMPVAPDNGGFSAMYYAMIGGQWDTFTLNEDGTWTGV